MDLVELFLRYAIIPLATVICTLGWFMIKKQDFRIDNLEKRTNDIEKAVIEIQTEFKYVSRDIKEIKTMISKLSDK